MEFLLSIGIDWLTLMDISRYLLSQNKRVLDGFNSPNALRFLCRCAVLGEIIEQVDKTQPTDEKSPAYQPRQQFQTIA
jgi:hypothetical protein